MPKANHVVELKITPAQKKSYELLLELRAGYEVELLATPAAENDLELMVILYGNLWNRPAYLQASIWSKCNPKEGTTSRVLKEGNKVHSLAEPMVVAFDGIMYEIMLTCEGEKLTQAELWDSRTKQTY